MSQDLASNLATAMVRIVRMLKALDQEARLSPPCASALAVIVTAGRIRPGDVARIEGVTPASTTPVLKELTAKGLITRAPDLEDRRAAWVSPTAKGKRWFEEGHARAIHPLAQAIDDLGPSAGKTLAAALDHLRQIDAVLQAKIGTS